MDPKLVDRLICPACGGELSLEPFATAGDGETVTEGVLLCEPCRVWHPISSSVPVLLVFPTPLHRGFGDERRGELAALGGYRAPAGKPRAGEESIQETFSEEWSQARDSELSFTYSPQDLERLNREVWLRALGTAGGAAPGSILDVGCGLGEETIALRNALEAAEVVGVDLNLALLANAPGREASGVHYVVASLFDLPFRRASFDLVYSQGVLHHTFSTRTAFDAIASYVASGGYLFVWLYGLDDHLSLHGRRRLATRAGLAAETALRPLLSRAPRALRSAFFGVASRAAHPVLKPRLRQTASWTLADTNTYLRDWLSPRFAHRHGYNEVIEWFEEQGFEIVGVQSPRAYRELFGDRLWGVGLTGRRPPAGAEG